MPSNEQSLRFQVAAATLLLNDLGILGYSGHIGARLPGREAILIQSFDQSRSEVGPSDLLICDFDGKVIEGRAGVKPPSEIYLHCEIFRARADVNAIAHFHHDLTTAFTLAKGVKLAPVKNHAVRWASGIAVHADPSHVSDARFFFAGAVSTGFAAARCAASVVRVVAAAAQAAAASNATAARAAVAARAIVVLLMCHTSPFSGLVVPDASP